MIKVMSVKLSVYLNLGSAKVCCYSIPFLWVISSLLEAKRVFAGFLETK